MKYKATHYEDVKYYSTLEEIVDEYYTEFDYDMYLDMTYGDITIADCFFLASEIFKKMNPTWYMKKFEERKFQLADKLEENIKKSGKGLLAGKQVIYVEEAE